MRYVVLPVLAVVLAGVYLYRFDPFHTYSSAIVADDTREGDWFASSLAIHEDSAVISAFYADAYGDQSGAAYQLKSFAAMIQKDKSAVFTPLSINGLVAGDEGGFATAMNEHFLAIGAISGFAQPPGSRTSGRVLLFQRETTLTPWRQISVLRPPDPQPGDYYGYSVALSGRWLLIGAKHDDDVGMDAGAAYVYDLNSAEGKAGPTLFEILTAGPGSDGIEFGTHVEVDATDPAAPARIAVGAPYTNGTVTDTGAVHVFTFVDGSWQPEATLTVDNLEADAHLGIGVAMQGDTIIVGASHWADDGRLGAAYVFTLVDDGWKLTQTLSADDGRPGDMFGMRVDISGQQIVIGAHLADSTAKNAGAVYVFQRSCEGWIQVDKLIPGDGKRDDNFGIAMTLFGNSLLVGSELADVAGNDSGAVYGFALESGFYDLSACKL